MDDNGRILAALADLNGKVDALAKTVSDHQRKLKWITSAALLVIGAIGGPDAVQAVAGTTV